MGGLVGYANGYILNCYTSDNQYQLNNKSAGEIAGYSPSNYHLTVSNCATYNSQSQSSVYALTPSIKNATINHFFYNQGTLYNTANSSNVTKNDVYKYDSSFEANDVLVTTWMNNWIGDEGADTYSDFIFRTWNLKNGRITFE